MVNATSFAPRFVRCLLNNTQPDDLRREVQHLCLAFEATPPTPGSSLEGYVALKMRCSMVEARSLIRWAHRMDKALA